MRNALQMKLEHLKDKTKAKAIAPDPTKSSPYELLWGTGNPDIHMWKPVGIFMPKNGSSCHQLRDLLTCPLIPM